MKHACPLCGKRIPDPKTQGKSHLRSAHPTTKHWSVARYWLIQAGVQPFHRPFKKSKIESVLESVMSSLEAKKIVSAAYQFSR